MTTYNTYQEAKIANTECAVFEYQGNFGTDKEILDMFDMQSREMKECNPADCCMTVERFLADGHKFELGDVCIDHDGEVVSIDVEYHTWDKPDEFDSSRYVLRATALEDIPTETPEEKEVLDGIESAGEVEWKNGDECRYNEINWLFCGFHPVNRLAIVANNDAPSSHQVITVDVDLLSKPETPQQREGRERLEAAYDLYEESQHAIGCIDYDDFDFFKKSDIQVKFWLAIVDKANYRKEKTHGTN